MSASTTSPRRAKTRLKGALPVKGPVRGNLNLQHLMREKLAASSVFPTLLRVAEGKRVQATGPSGKKFWREISWSDQRWALQMLSAKVLPGPCQNKSA